MRENENADETSFFQVQMKMWCQTCEHPKAGVIVKFDNDPLALIQNLIEQG
jgi:hypothetical protein